MWRLKYLEEVNMTNGNRDGKEIRRLAILKSSTASLSPVSVLNLAMEILKTDIGTITVDALFQTAFQIVERLPELRDAINRINISAAEAVEEWITERDDDETGPVQEKAESGKNESDSTPTSGTVTGVVEAVAKTGNGIKLNNGTWYNITAKTKKRADVEKGDRVRIVYVRKSSGFMIEEIERIE
jgi:hypothetical protein